ncbi:MAG: septum site-determining protein MinC [Halomonadaceae bacterium]|nr:MAG: septum site-determining protein MinC [Halomonadaceae bacterium]
MTDADVPAQTRTTCFELKGGMLTLTLLELHYFDLDAFETTLREKIRQAPGFFRDLPLVISLDKYQRPAAELDFFQMIGCCRRHSIQVAAVRGGDEDVKRLARNASLAWLPSHAAKNASAEAVPPAAQDHDQAPAAVAVELPQTQVPEAPASTSGSATAARVITQPVRSGQQIYAPEGDLIIMAPVGAGAEVLAAGHVHVYGPLRGRALAGVHGDVNARIFCQSLEAELVSVAGHYKISEDLQGSCWKRPTEVGFRNNELSVRPLD